MLIKRVTWRPVHAQGDLFLGIAWSCFLLHVRHNVSIPSSVFFSLIVWNSVYGITILQAYIYFRNRCQDSMLMKLLVSLRLYYMNDLLTMILIYEGGIRLVCTLPLKHTSYGWRLPLYTASSTLPEWCWLSLLTSENQIHFWTSLRKLSSYPTPLPSQSIMLQTNGGEYYNGMRSKLVLFYFECLVREYDHCEDSSI